VTAGAVVVNFIVGVADKFQLAIEFFRAVLVGIAVFALIRKGRAVQVANLPGWNIILIGFSLVFFGTLIDITDEFQPTTLLGAFGATDLQAVLEKVLGYTLGIGLIAVGFWQWLPKLAELQRQTEEHLHHVESEVQTLSGLLPICAECKKVRDDSGYWNKIEDYISKHSDADFTHGICPECAARLYPDVKYSESD